MAITIFSETEAETTNAQGKTAKYVYFFGGGKAEGDGKMKDELGGKGAGLAEMTNAGLPVPPGFTIQTEACRESMRRGQVSQEVDQQMEIALKRLEELQGQELGRGSHPLLVSVRSGAKFSMPGMMDTILNLGLNDETVEALAKRSNNPRFAYDSYRRLIQMFGNVVLEIPKSAFEEVFEGKKKQKKAELDTDLDAKALQEVIAGYKKVVKKHSGRDFPQDPHQQLIMARDAVFRSWNNDRAKHYRRINNISDDLGTAVNVQAMVFGNLGESSGTGVGFTRNPATGEKEFFAEFLMNAQGEDVVAGIRTPLRIAELESKMPEVYRQLREITTRLERHYRDVQDFEFTIQDGKLYMLQTRNGKRTGIAAVRIAIQMVEEGLITKEEAVFRVEPNQLLDFLVPRLDEKDVKPEDVLTAHGLPASPGAAVGQIVFTADDAVAKAGHGAERQPVILVRAETTPEDIQGIEVAAGILTSKGGMTSHAAVVTRGMGKCCVAGAGEIAIDERTRQMRARGQVLQEGDWITLDGSSGRVLKGRKRLLPPDPENLAKLGEFMKWAEPFRKIGVRANADIPRDAEKAREFGAEGIGLCRTEHMFFAPKRVPHMRAMIMAKNEKDRRAALKKLLPMQRSDFAGLFRVMDGLPVTIRLLDPPLHEFLPKREELMVEIALLEATRPKSPKLKELRTLLRRVEELHEFNPMLGHRGCRLGITYPEITEMQARAIFEAAVAVEKEGIKTHAEVMIPLTATLKELVHQAAIVRRVAEEVFQEEGETVHYLVGTMIELPRAALIAGEIAQEAEFFSFGTNDLTQTTFGFSRDDVNKVLPTYLTEGILKQDPFAVLDREGVGELVRIGIERGRKTRPHLEVGICGEHGGDPASVEFCHQVGMDYVACSPFRVLTARLAAAQAGARDKLKLAADRTK
ncbi:MAG TPA: pyruvate, phosphate dikinase [Terriglobales bacterium]|nr:pyruvate, phosphate dikinase [Terriglobales bacterium]